MGVKKARGALRIAAEQEPPMNVVDRILEGWRCRHPREFCVTDGVLRRAYRVCTQCPTKRMVGVTDLPL